MPLFRSASTPEGQWSLEPLEADATPHGSPLRSFGLAAKQQPKVRSKQLLPVDSKVLASSSQQAATCWDSKPLLPELPGTVPCPSFGSLEREGLTPSRDLPSRSASRPSSGAGNAGVRGALSGTPGRIRPQLVTSMARNRNQLLEEKYPMDISAASPFGAPPPPLTPTQVTRVNSSSSIRRAGSAAGATPLKPKDTNAFGTDPVDNYNRRSKHLQALGAARLEEPRSPKKEAPEGEVLIFDWDDTLFPTAYVKGVVWPTLPEDEIISLPKDSPYYPVLFHFGEVLRDVLTAACKLGRVGIVTLAQRPWLHQSAELFLPGLNIETLLEELQIPVFYAREHLPHAVKMETLEADLGLCVKAKRLAMYKCIKHLSENAVGLTSIGDSEIELIAMKELVQHMVSKRFPSSEIFPSSSESGPFCKTVQLIRQPSLKQLQQQLEALSNSLHKVTSHQGHLELSLLGKRGPGGRAMPWPC